MNLIPADTTIDVMHKQFEILRNLTGTQRLQMAFELTNDVRKALKAGIRQRHPEYDEAQVHNEMLRITLGDELYNKVFEKAKDESRLQGEQQVE